MDSLIKKIFKINSEKAFNALSLKVFDYQYKKNKIYKSYFNQLRLNSSDIKSYKDIPCIPIDFFKTHKIITENKKIQTTFKSSGTTGLTTSSHHIIDLNIYEESFIKTFKT